LGKKQNFLTQNPTPFISKTFLSRFPAFLCMVIPKTPQKYLPKKTHKSQKIVSTYVAWFFVPVPVPVQVLAPQNTKHKNFGGAQGF
jgi:hypothetical protein